MAKRFTHRIGDIEGEGPTEAAARKHAELVAKGALESLSRDGRPFVVEFDGLLSLVYPMICADGVSWVYTNPRGADDRSPHATDRLGYTGWSGMYADHLSARSAALSHCIQYRGPIPPESTWPAGLNPRDTDNLRSLLAAQTAAAA
jgi:hypothetical protein